MKCSQLVFSGHAVQRMFERSIGKAEIASVIASGEAIQEYPEDRPYPSRLLLGFVDGKPLHVLAAQDENGDCYIVTCYQPGPELWEPDFKKRKPK